MTQSKTGRKALALFLAMMMLFSLLPASAMAEDPVTEEEIIEEWNEDSFIEDEIFEEEIIEEEPVYEEELFFEEEQPAEETEEVDEEAGLSLSDSETFDGDPDPVNPGNPGIPVNPVTPVVPVTPATPDVQWSKPVSYTSDQTFGRVEVTGNTTLTISEGKTVTINTHLHMDNGVTLTVMGGGTLSVTGIDYGFSGLAAISGIQNSIIVDNATVNLTGGPCSNGEGGSGIENCNVTVNNGTVTITGGTGTGGNGQAINGGTISIAEGSTGTITADSVSQSGKSYSGAALSVQVTAAPATVAVTDVTLDKTTLELGVGSTATLTAIVTPVNATDPKVKWSTGANRVALYEDPGYTIPVGTEPTDKLTVYVKGTEAGTTTITVTVDGNDAEFATCSVTVLEPVRYLTGEGSASNYCYEYTVVTGATDELNDGWYVVPADEQVDTNRMTVTGDVHLILCDGATLKNGGITVQDSNSLTIYAQSAGETAGTLMADAYSGNINIAGIGAMSNEGASGNAGTITINGGKISAWGGEYSAGIGGASNNNGINGNGGTVTINGGTVTTIGGKNAAGIGGGLSGNGGTVTINGGEVTATGRNGAAAIGAAYGGNPGTVTLGEGMIAYAGDSEPGVYVADYAGTANHSQPYAHVYKGTAPITGPYFTDNHQVNLSEQIELRFKLVLPEGFDTTDSYVDFSVTSGKTHHVAFGDEEFMKADQDNAYWFICPLNVLELNDSVSATYTYTGGTAEATGWTVMLYFEQFKQLYPTHALCKLIDALQNYGHYMQLSSWKDGTATEQRTHNNIVAASGSDISSIEDVRSAVASKAVSVDLGDSGINDAMLSLTLNQKTIINAYFNTNGVTIQETPNGRRSISGTTYYRFDSAPIKPTQLGDTIELTATTGSGTATVTASALSYVYAIVREGSSASVANQNAMAAFYDYYNVAKEFA